MYPHERSLVEKLKGQPFALLGINSDDNKDELKEAMEKEKITWRSWYDGSTRGPIAKQWGIKTWPSIFVLDAKGVIRAKDVRGEQLETAIALLLREMRITQKKQATAVERVAKTNTEPSSPVADRIPDEKEKQDELAKSRLKMAKELAESGSTDKARERLQDLIKKFPNTDAAADAKELLKKLKK